MSGETIRKFLENPRMQEAGAKTVQAAKGLLDAALSDDFIGSLFGEEPEDSGVREKEAPPDVIDVEGEVVGAPLVPIRNRDTIPAPAVEPGSFCEECGTRSKSTAKFCRGCGTKLG